MPCFTRVMVEVEDEKFNNQAREKLRYPLKGKLTEQQANMVKLEAGKLKTIAAAKKIDMFAKVIGNQVGSRKLTLKLEL